MPAHPDDLTCLERAGETGAIDGLDLALLPFREPLPDLLGEAAAKARRLAEPTTRSYLLAKLVASDPSLLDEALAVIDANPHEAERESLRRACLESLPESSKIPPDGEAGPHRSREA